ncbi:MAG: hypothetical protein RLZZ401_674 [Pseudomonadota bacterium]|jgi:small-conductance mechanosensitive channel
MSGSASGSQLGWAALQHLVADFRSPGVWVELLALVAAVALAYFVARWLAGHRTLFISVEEQEAESVWFGRRVLDGLLFPLLALVLVYVSKKLLDDVNPNVAILAVAVPMLSSLAVIRLVARVLTSVFPASPGAKLIERGVSWLAWCAAVLWILGFLPAVLQELDDVQFSFGKSRISLRLVIESVLSCALVLVLALWVSKVIEKRVLNQAVSDLSMRKAATNAVRAVLLLLGLLLALSAVGVDLTALSVLGGAVGVGLGFGLQKLAANYVSGFVILLERSMRIGDTIRIDNFEGRITDIKTRYTLIRANNGRESVVPNEKLMTERVENLSLADPNIALTCTVVVGYDSDVAQVQSLLCAAALAAAPRVLHDPAPLAMLSQFAADGLEFTLNFWINDPENGQLNVRSEVHIAMLHALRAARVDIPYPQRVVQMRS